MLDKTLETLQNAYQNSRQAEEATLPWLATRQDKALSALKQQGLPTRKWEGWRNTLVRFPEVLSFTPPSTTASVSEVNKHVLVDGPRCVFVNGIYQQALSTSEQTPGITITTLTEAKQSHPDLLAQYLGSSTQHDKQPFVALADANCQQGVCLLVEEGAEIKSPITCLFLTSDNTQGLIDTPRILVLGRSRSSLTLVEQHESTGVSQALHFPIVEVYLEAGASLHHNKIIQNKADNHASALFVTQQAESSFDSVQLNLEGALMRHEMTVRLMGNNARCTLNGVSIGKGEAHTEQQVTVIHESPETYSDQCFRGIFSKKSKGVYCGRVKVLPDAQKIQADQENHSLLLSPAAQAYTRPQLEIYADDVKCSHGATVGALDKKALFYLRSRGIDKLQARQLLLHAFARCILDKVHHEALRSALILRLEATLLQIQEEESDEHAK